MKITKEMVGYLSVLKRFKHRKGVTGKVVLYLTPEEWEEFYRDYAPEIFERKEKND